MNKQTIKIPAPNPKSKTRMRKKESKESRAEQNWKHIAQLFVRESAPGVEEPTPETYCHGHVPLGVVFHLSHFSISLGTEKWCPSPPVTFRAICFCDDVSQHSVLQQYFALFLLIEHKLSALLSKHSAPVCASPSLSFPCLNSHTNVLLFPSRTDVLSLKTISLKLS